jgi:NTE family protein
MTTDNSPLPHRAIIFQGGGALGAYEAGVFELLYDRLKKEDEEKAREDPRYKDRPLFDIVAGTSIGALNATILVNHVLEKRRANINMKISDCWEGSVETLSRFWDDLSEFLWWHPKSWIDNWLLPGIFFSPLLNYWGTTLEFLKENYKLFFNYMNIISELNWFWNYASKNFPVLSFTEGWPYIQLVNLKKEDWRERWPQIISYFFWPDKYSPIASPESARRYYSYLFSLFIGAPKVLSPAIFPLPFPLPAAIFQPDVKFFDPLQFTLNAFFRFDNTPLENTMMRYWNYMEYPKIKTNAGDRDTKDREPRLLLVTIDALDCTTAVSFDSYPYSGKTCELCDRERNKFVNTEEYIQHLYNVHRDQVHQLQHEEEGDRKRIWKSVYGGEQNTRTIFYDGIELNHVRASMSIHQRYKYPEINVLTGNDKEEKEKPRIFWDGAYLSNTPLREVIQEHQNYWKEKIEDIERDSIPNLEVYIVNLYPTTEKNFSSDADTIKDREVDIRFHDRTSYDIKVAEMTTDYINLSRQLEELVNEAKSKIPDSNDKNTIDTKLKNLLFTETKSRRRNGERRLYRELIEKRFEVSKAVYIERSDEGNTIFGKSFDFSSSTLQQLKQAGYDDAKSQIDLELIGEQIKDWLMDEEEYNEVYRDTLEQLLQRIRLCLKHQDIGETRSELNNLIQLIEQVAGQDAKSKLLIAKINKL